MFNMKWINHITWLYPVETSPSCTGRQHLLGQLKDPLKSNTTEGQSSYSSWHLIEAGGQDSAPRSSRCEPSGPWRLRGNSNTQTVDIKVNRELLLLTVKLDLHVWSHLGWRELIFGEFNSKVLLRIKIHLVLNSTLTKPARPRIPHFHLRPPPLGIVLPPSGRVYIEIYRLYRDQNTHKSLRQSPQERSNV